MNQFSEFMKPALHRRHPHALAHYLEGAGARISGPAALLTDVAVVVHAVMAYATGGRYYARA